MQQKSSLFGFELNRSVANNFFRYLQLASMILKYPSGILAYTELSTGRIFKVLAKKQTKQQTLQVPSIIKRKKHESLNCSTVPYVDSVAFR